MMQRAARCCWAWYTAGGSAAAKQRKKQSRSLHPAVALCSAMQAAGSAVQQFENIIFRVAAAVVTYSSSYCWFLVIVLHQEATRCGLGCAAGL
jgi:hypothetical protein